MTPTRPPTSDADLRECLDRTFVALRRQLSEDIARTSLCTPIPTQVLGGKTWPPSAGGYAAAEKG